MDAQVADNQSGVRAVTEIQSSVGWWTVDLGELWRYRELALVLTWRDLKVKYRQTLLGVLWIVGQPLIVTAIFTLVFNHVARIEAPFGIPYPLFALTGLIPWVFFASGIQSSSNSLVGNSHLISKIYFPRLLVPTAAILSGAVDFAVTFVLIGGMMAWYGIAPGQQLWLFPVAVALVFVLTAGTGYWLSALNVEYRDVRVLVPFLVQVGLYVTPVVYPREMLPEPLARMALFNPMTGLVEVFRAAVLGTPIPWGALGVAAVLTVMVAVSGACFFARVERSFADLL